MENPWGVAETVQTLFPPPSGPWKRIWWTGKGLISSQVSQLPGKTEVCPLFILKGRKLRKTLNRTLTRWGFWLLCLSIAANVLGTKPWWFTVVSNALVVCSVMLRFLVAIITVVMLAVYGEWGLWISTSNYVSCINHVLIFLHLMLCYLGTCWCWRNCPFQG